MQVTTYYFHKNYSIIIVSKDSSYQDIQKAKFQEKNGRNRKETERKKSTDRTRKHMADRFIQSNSTFVRHDSTNDDNGIPVKAFTPWPWREEGHPCFHGYDNRRKSKFSFAKSMKINLIL